MLSESERHQFNQSIEAVEKMTGQALAKHQHRQQSVVFFQELHRNIDAVSQRAFASQPPAKCQAGCSHCCKNKRVEVSAPEALYIAKHLKQLPQDAFRLLLERIRHDAENQAIQTQKTPKVCTFLIDDLCSIYAFRPAVCRKAHSLSAEACAEAAPSIPQHLHVILDVEAMIIGTARAYETIGWSAKSLELNAALLAVLIDVNGEKNRKYR